MFKVKVITKGKNKELWLQEALKEYETRLKASMKIEWVLLEKEKTFQERVLQEKEYITLDLRGKALSSEHFSQHLFEKWGSNCIFVIGGAEGLSSNILAKAKDSISLSSLTFTHQMVRLILIEQLYRAIEIHKNSSYHK